MIFLPHSRTQKEFGRTRTVRPGRWSMSRSQSSESIFFSRISGRPHQPFCICVYISMWCWIWLEKDRNDEEKKHYQLVFVLLVFNAIMLRDSIFIWCKHLFIYTKILSNFVTPANMAQFYNTNYIQTKYTNTYLYKRKNQFKQN